MAHITVVEQIKSDYSGCVFLVHPKITVLARIGEEVLAAYPVVEFNVGLYLSTALRDVLLSDRGRIIQRWLNDEIRAVEHNKVLCTQVDLLFEPSFGIDPLMLFKHIARNKQIIVLWPGDYLNGTLAYASPDHSHYRTWQISDPTLSIHRIENEF